MANPVPFRVKNGPWKAIVGGKLEELAPSEATKEEAQTKLASMLATLPQKQKPKFSLLSKVNTEPTKLLEDSDSESSTDSPIVEKPKTGELRVGGLASLAPAKVAKFREVVATALASSNVSLDRALITIFRDKVPVIPPDQYILLAAGWELACEQYFVNGLPPPWIVILLGNLTVIAKLYESSEPKPEPKPEAITDQATRAATGG